LNDWKGVPKLKRAVLVVKAPEANPSSTKACLMW
jgi:hypothetical protein